jgi:hypothetical protein
MDGLICIERLQSRVWQGEEFGKPNYSVSILTKPVELNEELLTIFSEKVQKMIVDSGAKGEISFQVELDRNGSAELPSYSVTVNCLDNLIKMKDFPYAIKDVRGKLVIGDGKVKFVDMKGVPASDLLVEDQTSSINMNGEIHFAEEGIDRGEFEFSAGDIWLDDQFGDALPETFKDIYCDLSPNGRFDLSGGKVKIAKGHDGKKETSFEGLLKLKKCDFETDLPIKEVWAEIEAKGLFNGGLWFEACHFQVRDGSLRIKDKSLNDIQACLEYDGDGKRWYSKDVMANFYDGRLLGDLELYETDGGGQEYLLQASFEDVDLKKFLSDRSKGEKEGNGYTSGRMVGMLNLQGRLGDVDSRIGRCRLKVTGMEIGRLSPLAKLLQVLQLNNPQDYAFEEMAVDSYVKGENLFFKQFDLSGKNLAFAGSGSLGFEDLNVDITLTARGKRLANAEPTLLQSLTDALGRGVVRMEVTGDLYDFQVRTRALPVLKDTLGLLGTERVESD